MNTLFSNLKVISQLEENQKLYVSGDDLVIDDNGYLSPFFRKWYGEDREVTLKRIREIVKDSIEMGNNAIRSETGNDESYLENSETSLKIRSWELERDKVTSKNNIGFLELLISEMTGMIQGIHILEKTYGTDKTLCSKLEVEVQNINANIDKFKKYLSGNSKKMD